MRFEDEVAGEEEGDELVGRGSPIAGMEAAEQGAPLWRGERDFERAESGLSGSERLWT
jgi:hypothetical protein